MSDQDVDAALEAQHEALYGEGDVEKAQRLYSESIGNVDPFGTEVAVPAPVDAPQEAPAKPESRDLTIATMADDVTVTITGEMDFAGNPEHVTQALEAMAWWDQDEDGNSNGDRVETLKAKWGSDMGANLAFYQAFALAHPEINEILTAAGFGDHPVIIEVGAALGRKYATHAGDPSRITTQKSGAKMVAEMDQVDFDAKTEALQNQQLDAQARGNTAEAEKIDREIRRLFVQRYGTDPIVGEGGRTL